MKNIFAVLIALAVVSGLGFATMPLLQADVNNEIKTQAENVDITSDINSDFEFETPIAAGNVNGEAEAHAQLKSHLLKTGLFDISFNSDAEVDADLRIELEKSEVIIARGTAEKGGELSSVFFIGIDREEKQFRYNFLFVDGKLYELDAKNVQYDSETRTLIMNFNSEKGAARLMFRNYHGHVFVSGDFDGWLMNMRIFGFYKSHPLKEMSISGDKIAVTEKSPQQIAAEIVAEVETEID